MLTLKDLSKTVSSKANYLSTAFPQVLIQNTVLC